MEQNKSAILQMLMGERGNFECIRFSEEYRKTRKKSLDKLLEFEKQLKEYPQNFLSCIKRRKWLPTSNTLRTPKSCTKKPFHLV